MCVCVCVYAAKCVSGCKNKNNSLWNTRKITKLDSHEWDNDWKRDLILSSSFLSFVYVSYISLCQCKLLQGLQSCSYILLDMCCKSYTQLGKFSTWNLSLFINCGIIFLITNQINTCLAVCRSGGHLSPGVLMPAWKSSDELHCMLNGYLELFCLSDFLYCLRCCHVYCPACL